MRCARLAFNTIKYAYEDDGIEIVCIENNPEFVKVGKRVLPQATWIEADAFDRKTYDDIGQFRCVISNPPYGISRNGNANWLKKGPSQYMAAEIAMMTANYGVFILNQADCPFKQSGVTSYAVNKCEKYDKWHKETGIILGNNCGLDLSMYDNHWEGTRQRVEVVLVQKGDNYNAKHVRQAELF